MKHHSKHTLNAAVSAGLWLSLFAAPACSDALSGAPEGSLAETEASQLAPSDEATTRIVLSGSADVELDADDADDSGSVTLTPREDGSGTVTLTPSEGGSGSVTLTPGGGGSGSVILTPGEDDSGSVVLGGDAGVSLLGSSPSGTGSANSRVRVVATNGSGCAGREATVSAVADDLSSFSISFGGYTAALGPDRTIQRQNCIFAIEVDPPPGMTYAVTHVPLSGQASLQEDATGRIAIQYFYQGEPLTSGTGADIPTTVGRWSTDGAFAADQVQSAPCGPERALLLNTSAVVNGEVGETPSSVTVDPVFSVQLALSACP